MTTEPYVIEIYDSFRAIDFDSDINYGAQETIVMIKYVCAQHSMKHKIMFKKELRELAFENLKEVLISRKSGLDAVPYYLSIIHYLNT